MKIDKTPVLPTPPSLLKALMAGFDAVTTNVWLILFPVGLDLLLWLGPRLSIQSLAAALARQASAVRVPEGDAGQMMQANQEMWAYIGEHFNLLFLLRSYPVGLPSLIVARQPLLGPGGMAPLHFDVLTIGNALLWLLLLTVAGLAAGTLYYAAVSETALKGQVRWGDALRQWPKSTGKVVALAALWHGLVLGAGLPALCLVSLLVMSGVPLGRFGLLLYLGVMFWVLFPLLFSPHGIFVYRSGIFASVSKGVKVFRMTLPSTSILFVMMLLISEGLEVLWQIPEETSWFLFIGILGHSFIATGLLAASFIYYRDADQWVQAMQTFWGRLPSARSNV